MKGFIFLLSVLALFAGCKSANVRGFGKVSSGTSGRTMAKKIDSISTTQGRVIDVLDTLAGMVMQSEDRLRSLEERAQALERSVDTSRRVKTSSAEAIMKYDSALRLITARDYKSALFLLDGLERSYPDDPLRGNFLYWEAMCLYQMESYWAALRKFQAVIEEHASTKIDDALLMSGKTYIMLHDDAKAREAFHALLEQFPDSEYAIDARSLLNE